MKAKNLSLFISVLVLTAVSVFFVYPNIPAVGDSLSKFLPWRLGLDLVGGSYLVYEVDMSQIKSADRDLVMNGLRDVIEKRVNLFGVASPGLPPPERGKATALMLSLRGLKI